MANTRNRLLMTTIASLTMSVGAAPIVYAQQTTNPSVETLGTIMVEATDTSSLAGTGDTVTINAAELAHTQPTTVAQAVAEVPGVSVARADDLVNSNISIRNFGGNSAVPSSQTVVFALDGTSIAGGGFYRNTAGQVVDPLLLRSISVLKGPLASLEYGSGIVGGTIAMETINASDLTGDKPGVKVRQVLGANSNGNGWKTSTTLAWQPDESFDMLMNYSRTYSQNKKDGNGDNINLGGYNLPSILLKGRYRFGDAKDHSLTFTYDKSKSVQQNVPFAMSTIAAAFGNVNRERNGHVASIAYAYQPDNNPLVDFELKYTQSRQHMTIEGLSFLSSMLGGEFDVDTDQLTAKNTARFSTGWVDHTLRTGLEFSHQNHDGIMSGIAGEGKYNRYGVFAIDQMDFGNDLNVTAAVRVERQRLYDLAGLSGAALDDASTTARSAGLGFEKGIGAGFSGYGSFAYSEGLTLPEYAGYRDPDGTYWGDRVYKSRSWEAGVKYYGGDLFDAGDSLIASAGLYKTDIWDNSTYPGTGYSMISTEGLEAQLGYKMANGLYAKGSLTTTFNNKYSSNANVAWVQYEYAMRDQAALTVGKTWENSLDVSWTLRGGAKQDIGRVHQSGWGVSDIAASYTFQSGSVEGLRVDFGIDNVFDKQYVQQYTTTSPSYPEAGRNVKVTFSKTF